MMKAFGILIAITFVFTATSCDVVSRVTVWNYGKEREVIVEYGLEKQGNSFWSNTDTLIATQFETQKDKSVIITNIDSTTYRFQIPENYRVELQPKSLGTPIKRISVLKLQERTLVVNISGEDWKRMKKAGIVKTKGIMFTRDIIININE